MGVIMKGSMRSIAVLGSLNADLVIQMDRYPNPGETVVAKSFAQFSGGKGANQAVACGRLDATVSMFGAVDQALEQIRKGTMDATIAQQPALMGQLGVGSGRLNTISPLLYSKLNNAQSFPVPVKTITAGDL